MKDKKRIGIGSKVMHKKFTEWRKGTVVNLEDGKASVSFPWRFEANIWIKLEDLKLAKKKKK